MSVTIEGYTVVVKKELIIDLLEDGTIVPPNGMHLGDPHVWRCSFMAEADAEKFLGQIAELAELNVTQGPDPDGVIVSEFKREVHPYCEWLQTATWEKAVIAWKVGTDPTKLFAREGFDPKVGSGLTMHVENAMEDLEFVRLEGNIEVYFNNKLGKEVYLARTTPSPEARFKSACDVIRDQFRVAGETKLEGAEATEVEAAVETLDSLIEEFPDWWQALFFHGKGMMALGKLEQAYHSLSRAAEIESGTEAVLRELGGICLELKRFDKAIEINQRAVALQPDNAGSLGNLAVTYLLARNLPAAVKSIEAAIGIDPKDSINQVLQAVIQKVNAGVLPPPTSMDEVNRAATDVKRGET
ncbi:MAG: tetratricopeptide repeat protein [Planctomycetota bacterium]